MTTPKFTIAIIGGGIAGLTSAIALSRLNQNNDIKIDIYEGAHAFTEIGAGVGVWKRPWGILKKLGLAEDLSKVSKAAIADDPQLSFSFRKSDQAIGLHYYDMAPPMGLLPFHRPDFLDCLASNLPQDRASVHFGKRLVSYSISSGTACPITLDFMDGSTARCHVIIGADGVHSVARKVTLELAVRDLEAKYGESAAATLREKIEPVWTGLTAYRTVANAEKLRALNPGHGVLTGPRLYNGKRKNVTAYPIANGRLVNVAAFHCYREKSGTKHEGKLINERTKEQLVQDFEGWEEEVVQLLQCVEKANQWVVMAMDELPVCTYGNAALLGDAAHAMAPFQGSGAGQAVEDAYILGSLLGHPLVTLETVPAALKIYEQIRLPHANEVQRRSLRAAWLISFQDPRCARFDALDGESTVECTGDDTGRLWEIGHEMVTAWMWAWTTDIEDDRAKAIKLLEEKLGQ